MNKKIREEKLKPFAKSKSQLRRLISMTENITDEAFLDYIEKKKNVLRKNNCRGCNNE